MAEATRFETTKPSPDRVLIVEDCADNLFLVKAYLNNPAFELDTAGNRIVTHLLENGPDALKQTKAHVLASAFADLDEPAFAALVDAHAAKRQSAEAAEGLASFAEKRAARWGESLP